MAATHPLDLVHFQRVSGDVVAWRSEWKFLKYVEKDFFAYPHRVLAVPAESPKVKEKKPPGNSLKAVQSTNHMTFLFLMRKSVAFGQRSRTLVDWVHNDNLAELQAFHEAASHPDPARLEWRDAWSSFVKFSEQHGADKNHIRAYDNAWITKSGPTGVANRMPPPKTVYSFRVNKAVPTLTTFYYFGIPLSDANEENVHWITYEDGHLLEILHGLNVVSDMRSAIHHQFKYVTYSFTLILG